MNVLKESVSVKPYLSRKGGCIDLKLESPWIGRFSGAHPSRFKISGGPPAADAAQSRP